MSGTGASPEPGGLAPPAGRRGASPSRIYTRTGDAGETGLLGPSRVSKAHPRVEAYGSIDELNGWLGLARVACDAASPLKERLSPILLELQQQLFTVGSELALDPEVPPGAAGVPRVQPEDVKRVERWIDELDAGLAPLRSFVLPGGSPAGAVLHAARTVARRAERRVVALASREPVRPEVLAFLNRLSDLLFVMARQANALAGVPETPWTAPPPVPPAP